MTYSVGDVFIGCPASFTGRPYNQPTVLHYAPDGVTLLDTLTVPVGPAVNEEYALMGVAVGADGRCYVVWTTPGSVVPLVDQGAWLGVFDGDGNWVEQLAVFSLIFTAPPDAFVHLIALPGGDLGVVIRSDAMATTTIARYQSDGTLVDSWTAPAVGVVNGFALKPGTPTSALLLIEDQAYVVSLVDGSATGPVTVPYDALNEAPHALLTSRTAPYLVIQDSAAAEDVWRLQQISADLLSNDGVRAEIASASFPGGGVSHFGLVNRPWDAAIDGEGTFGWGVTFTTDLSHSGSALDSTFRTDVRTTAVPGGTSSAVQSDVNGDSNLIYVYQGFGVTTAHRRRARVGLIK